MFADLVMMGLGTFRFGMRNEAYQTLVQTASFRWEKVDRIGRAPALQYLGPDAQTISIEGVIYPAFRGGLRQVDLMRLQAGTGVPFMMVSGAGLIFKRWVITQVTERKSYLLRDGAPQKIEFTLSLQAYGEDGNGFASIVRALL